MMPCNCDSSLLYKRRLKRALSALRKLKNRVFNPKEKGNYYVRVDKRHYQVAENVAIYIRQLEHTIWLGKFDAIKKRYPKLCVTTKYTKNGKVKTLNYRRK